MTCSAEIRKRVIQHTYRRNCDRCGRVLPGPLAGICLDKVDSVIDERGFYCNVAGIRREFVVGIGSVAMTGWVKAVDIRVTGRLFFLYPAQTGFFTAIETN